MFDLATAATEAALAAGASYADARARSVRYQSIDVLNGDVEGVNQGDEAGLGVRALYRSGWGFAATADLTPAGVAKAGADAAAIAKASATVARGELRLGSRRGEPDRVAHHGYRRSLRGAPRRQGRPARRRDQGDGRRTSGAAGSGLLAFSEEDTWLVSSEGHRIHQVIVTSGGGMDATSVGAAETQCRSYPQAFGQYETGGYEVVRRFDLPGNAGRLAAEAAALLTAPECPSGEMDLVLESSQLALQIHESIGHAIELDRILGWEAAFAGTSFLDLTKLGSFRYGSPLLRVTADATLAGALGSFGFDDEGTPAQCVDIVRDGVWVGVLSGRDSAAEAGIAAGGMVRGEGYAGLPMVRMTNVNLAPDTGTLEDLVGGVDDGVYLATNRSWSIDDKRLNFQFGCEAAWEIKGGRLGRLLRNPSYTGITPRFWGALDAVAGPEAWQCWGVPNCGKGQPLQTARTGHGTAPARFRGVRVGVRA